MKGKLAKEEKKKKQSLYSSSLRSHIRYTFFLVSSKTDAESMPPSLNFNRAVPPSGYEGSSSESMADKGLCNEEESGVRYCSRGEGATSFAARKIRNDK